MRADMTEMMDALRRLLPACVTEAKGKDGQLRPAIDFDALRQELSDQLVDGPAERYQLTWPGKRAAMQLANEPCAKTLRPCRQDSVRLETTKNLFIEGDNLDALKLLQETYLGRVKAIYIDPPYNTGKDFIYSDKFAMSKKEWEAQTGERAERGRLIANPDSGGRFHSRWLSMMWPRLKLARNLLARNGVIFISIDDHEQHNLRKLMDEIFGAINFVAQFCWWSKYTMANNAKVVSRQHEFVFAYAKEIDEFQIGLLPRSEKMDAAYKNPDNDERGPYKLTPLHAIGGSARDYSITFPNGVTWKCPKGRSPSYSEKQLLELYYDNRIWFGRDNELQPNKKTFLTEVKQGKTAGSVLHFKDVGSTHEANEDIAKLMGKGMFANPKPVRLVEHLLRLSTSPTSSTLAPGQSSDDAGGDIVMDFFAGSGTTGHAVMKLNQEDGGHRRFILVQWPEKCGENTEAFKAGYQTIADIAKERIRRAANQLGDQSNHSEPELDTGFRVLKIDDSNFQDCRRRPHEYKQEDLIHLADNLRPNRQPLDLLFETMLDLGIDLTASIHTQTIHKKPVFFLADNQVIACFEEGLTEELAQTLATYKPRRAVFRDGGFASDAVRINIGQLFQQLSPSTHLTII